MRFFERFIFLLFPVAVVLGTFTTLPRDTAAKRDATNVRLNCSTDKEHRWLVTVGWRLMPIEIYPIDPSPNPNFTAEDDGSSIYINSLTDDLAAVYSCVDSEDTAANARVASIDVLECPDDLEVSAGDEVTSTCSVSYSAAYKLPIKDLLMSIALLNHEEEILVEQRADTAGILTIQTIQTADLSFDSKPFHCSIFFEGENGETAADTNLPLYTESCSFNIFVLHAVTEVEFDAGFVSDEEKQVYVDDIINCTANGRPAPTFNWLDSENKVLSQNASLLLTNEMVGSNIYFCQATNELSDVPHVVSKMISLQVINRQAEVKSEGVAPWIIAISVLIPLLILIPLIAVLIACCIKKRRGSQPYKPKPPKKTKTKGGKSAYSSTPTKDLIYTPSRGTNAGPPSYGNGPELNKVPARPLYGNGNGSEKYANQNEFNAAAPLTVSSGHGALGMSGLGGSNQDLVGSKGSVNNFPSPPKKQTVLNNYNPVSPNERTTRPPLSETDSMSPSKRGAAKKKPTPLLRPPSVNSNSTNRSLMSSDVTSGAEGRVPSERRKKKKGGEYVVNGSSAPAPPEQYRQKGSRPAARKNPASSQRRQDDSDGSEV